MHQYLLVYPSGLCDPKIIVYSLSLAAALLQPIKRLNGSQKFPYPPAPGLYDPELNPGVTAIQCFYQYTYTYIYILHA